MALTGFTKEQLRVGLGSEQAAQTLVSAIDAGGSDPDLSDDMVRRLRAGMRDAAAARQFANNVNLNQQISDYECLKLTQLCGQPATNDIVNELGKV